MSTSLGEMNLRKQLKLLERAQVWLKRSLQQCEKSDPVKGLDDAEYDALEALASRYARVVDLLISKVFRAIDEVEFLEVGSVIDAVNRAEGRSLVTVAEARLLKELRNRIVHEYETEDLAKLLLDIRSNSRTLLHACGLTSQYAQRFQ